MRIVYPNEIDALWDSIPDEYRKDIKNAPKEYQKRYEIWREKKHEYDEEVRKELFGF